MICNVALTIPARIVIGSLVDRHGPRRVFAGLLVFTGAVSIYFSLATSFGEFLVSRLLMGCAGAGFVVGIKMIAEWFPPDRMGTAGLRLYPTDETVTAVVEKSCFYRAIPYSTKG